VSVQLLNFFWVLIDLFSVVIVLVLLLRWMSTAVDVGDQRVLCARADRPGVWASSRCVGSGVCTVRAIVGPSSISYPGA
jgi:hypothetical protein